MSKAKSRKTPKPQAPIPKIYQDQEPEPDVEPGFLSPRRRLGYVPSASNSPAPPSISHHDQGPKRIYGESSFPIYWVEVLDVAHQKWVPVDPLVTRSQWNPAKLEPPASDRLNALAYAIGFAEDNSAKDVTRRYAKAFNSKTRRLRIDSLDSPNPMPGAAATGNLSGTKWLRRALRRYRPPPADLNQIEDTELAALEGREPMPRNVADFKDHPVYALERHLRRHEVLPMGSKPCGTVSAGSKAPVERIFRRRDVRVCRSADKWYRLGRVVRGDEIPTKWLPRQKSGRRGNEEDEEEDPVLGPGEVNGTPMFTPEQTDPYVAPPVVNGHIPKNKFGNVDVYVPSMVPAGGTHVLSECAGRAAFLLGIDYAPALTGFEFSGRRGTAVLRGAVVPTEAVDAVWAVIEGLYDLEAEAEAERKSRVALRKWVRFLHGLRIRRQIVLAAQERGEHVDDDELHIRVDEDGEGEEEGGGFEAPSNTTEELDMVMGDGEGGGGFLVE